MHIFGITLSQFRLHKLITFEFAGRATVVVGPNGSGKSSILEALSLISRGESFRSGVVAQMISFDQELARVQTAYASDAAVPGKERDTVEVVVTRGVVQGKKTHSRLYLANSVRRRKQDVVGRVACVIFLPEDMRLVEGSPSRRRSYLDSVLSSVHPEYAQTLSHYEKSLIRKNKVLQGIQEGLQPVTVLKYWNEQLLQSAQVLQQFRTHYAASSDHVRGALDFSLEYISTPLTLERQQEYQSREIAAGHTLVGPHKDDIRIWLQKNGVKRELDLYGSRGQQRLGVLWLKQLESEYIQQIKHTQPVWLLDDVLSELDSVSRARALETVGDAQVIVTTTEESLLDEIQSVWSDVSMIRLADHDASEPI